MSVVMIMTAVIVIMMLAVTVVLMRGLAGRMCWPSSIGAALRIERRFNLDHARAEPLHHGLDDMVAPDPKTLSHDLGRQVPIAEMPGNPNEMMGIPAPNFSQRFRGRDDFYEAAILQNKCVSTS